jgi:hypothetical protein
MAHIPNEAVERRIEYIVQRDRQFDRAEPGGKVAAAGTDAVDQKLPQLGGQRLKLGGRQPTQVSRIIDGFEQRVLLGQVDHRRQFTLRRGRAGNGRGARHAARAGARICYPLRSSNRKSMCAASTPWVSRSARAPRAGRAAPGTPHCSSPRPAHRRRAARIPRSPYPRGKCSR